MHFNFRSLASKFDEFKLFLAQLKEKNLKPDIIMLYETWLNDVNKDLFSLDGYSFVEKHRGNDKGGGVALYVKNKHPV